MKKILLLLMVTIVAQGCTKLQASATETERTICRELRADLPSYSVNDTKQSKEEGDRFLAKFEAVCPA